MRRFVIVTKSVQMTAFPCWAEFAFIDVKRSLEHYEKEFLVLDNVPKREQ
jgi:hypothetical protein